MNLFQTKQNIGLRGGVQPSVIRLSPAKRTVNYPTASVGGDTGGQTVTFVAVEQHP